MGRIVNLIKVSGETNNNKFYNMVENGSVLEVTYGRVGSNGVKKLYDIWEWDRLYSQKINKGYSEITKYNRQLKESVNLDNILDNEIKDIVNILMTRAAKGVSDTYSVGIDQITTAKIVEAQAIIDSLLEYKIRRVEVSELNRRLCKLFEVIPRKMKRVNDYLLDSFDTTKIKEIVANEQQLLDNLKTQVVQNEVSGEDPLEKAGLFIENITNEEKKLILEKLGDNAKQFVRAFKVINKETQEKYDNNLANATNKEVELFWHGSRTENWWSILSTGLKIRPSGVATTGAMWGHGIYFADKARKSIGYTSLSNSYWAKGTDNIGYLALFEVNIGKQKHFYNHTSSCCNLNYKIIQKDGCDSVYAHAGRDLINNEFIVYNENQVTVKYIVEIKK